MKGFEISNLRCRAGGFREFEDILDSDFPIENYNEVLPERDDSNKSLFDLVFSVNPRTRLPDGDLAVYMSANTSPEVKRFIEMQLHNPSNTSGDVPFGDYGEISDDDIAFFTRSRNESVSDYRNRCYDRLLQYRDEVQSKSNN